MHCEQSLLGQGWNRLYTVSRLRHPRRHYRDIVLTLAREGGLPVQEGHYGVDALYEAEECFLTNTSMELMPVTTIEQRPVGSGKPGPITHRLQTQFVVNRRRFLETNQR